MIPSAIEVLMQPASKGALGPRVVFPPGILGRAEHVFSGGLPLHASSFKGSHGTVPLLGAMESVIRPASPPGGAGQGMVAHPDLGIAYFPQLAPAAAVAPAPLTPGLSFLTVLGILTALGAAGYVAFR
jgi:hypothetical protein